MSETFRNFTGRSIENDLPLTEYLGGTTNSAVFATTYSGRKAVVKLIAAGPSSEEHLERVRLAEKLSHPNLLRVFKSGSGQLDDEKFLYVVTEFAEENLSQVLPDRALTPQETGEVLQSALAALSYLHAQGLVHGDLKPANIMAAHDQLKLSADGLHPNGEALTREPDPHDAPEAKSAVSPATDVWSVGMMLVEVLTQRLPEKPASENAGPAVPETVPAPFREIAQHCLLRTPELRWSLAEISSKLNPKAAAATPASEPAPAKTTASPRRSMRPVVLLAVIVVIVAGIVLLSRHRSGDNAQVALGVVQQQPAKIETPASAPTASSEPASKPPDSVPTTTASAPASEPEPTLPAPAPKPADAAPVAPAIVPAPKPATKKESQSSDLSAADGIVDKVMPEVLPQARNSIQGKVRVKLALDVDSSGNVVDSRLVSPGPSKYFANAALSAARKWKFAPASAESRSWQLDFYFRRSGTDVRSTQRK